MATCPSCGSARLRNGYRAAPFPLRAVGIRTLLCDNCNYEFRAFSPLPPKRSQKRHTPRKADVFNTAPAVDLQMLNQAGSEGAQNRRTPAVNFNRAALPTSPPANPPAPVGQQFPPDFDDYAPVTPAAQPSSAWPTDLDDDLPPTTSVTTKPGVLPPPEAREQITVPPPVTTEEPLMRLKEDLEERRRHRSQGHTCPTCGSHDINRRHRKTWERIVFGLTKIRPYWCESCGAKFYAQRRPSRSASLVSRKEAEFVKESCFNQEEAGSEAQARAKRE